MGFIIRQVWEPLTQTEFLLISRNTRVWPAAFFGARILSTPLSPKCPKTKEKGLSGTKPSLRRYKAGGPRESGEGPPRVLIPPVSSIYRKPYTIACKRSSLGAPTGHDTDPFSPQGSGWDQAPLHCLLGTGTQNTSEEPWAGRFLQQGTLFLPGYRGGLGSMLRDE